MHTINSSYFSNSYGDVGWWQAVHDIGHFNTVRAMAYLGNWYTTGTNYMDLATLEGILDTFVANAQKTGMYVIIDCHSGANEPGSIDWDGNDTVSDTYFWTNIAPRYANATNVIYEIQNEPDLGTAGGPWAVPQYENELYTLIRGYAPKTPIIAWSFSTVEDAALIANASINYSNAIVGFHGYGAGVSNLISGAQALQASGYPVMATEFETADISPPDLIPAFEAAWMSWDLLTDGFCHATTGTCYGTDNPDSLSITWPEN